MQTEKDFNNILGLMESVVIYAKLQTPLAPISGNFILSKIISKYKKVQIDNFTMDGTRMS